MKRRFFGATKLALHAAASVRATAVNGEDKCDSLLTIRPSFGVFPIETLASDGSVRIHSFGKEANDA